MHNTVQVVNRYDVPLQAIKKNHPRVWCGPGALSALTGMGVKECCAKLREVTGRRAITRCMYFRENSL